MNPSLRCLLLEGQSQKPLEGRIPHGEVQSALLARYKYHHPEFNNEPWFQNIVWWSHTTATKSPRFGPLINHSRIISSTLNLNKYWEASFELCPQWNEVRIVRWAEIGWPAYKEGKLVETVANGVDRTCTVTAATIYELFLEVSNLKHKKITTCTHIHQRDIHWDLNLSPPACCRVWVSVISQPLPWY